MDWLGHKEFGQGYHPHVTNALTFSNPLNLNHWLEQWNLVHKELLKQVKINATNLYFICYEKLCSSSMKSWNNICLLLSISKKDTSLEMKKHKVVEGFNADLLKECEATYSELLHHTRL